MDPQMDPKMGLHMDLNMDLTRPPQNWPSFKTVRHENFAYLPRENLEMDSQRGPKMDLKMDPKMGLIGRQIRP